MADVKTTMEIELAGQAAAGLEHIENTIKSLKAEFISFARIAEKGINFDKTLKPLNLMSDLVEKVAVNLKTAGVKAQTFGTEAKTAANEAAGAFRVLDTEIRRVQSDAAKGAKGSFGSGAASTRAARESATSAARARRVTRNEDAFDFSNWKTLQRIRSASARNEECATRDSERAVVRADKEHLAGIVKANREHARGRAAQGRAARHIGAGARESVRSLDHGFGSPAVTAAIGLGIGAGISRRIIMEAARIDDAATRFRMLAVPPGADPTAVTGAARAQALKDSIRLGVGADAILDIQSKAVRDGITPEIARTLPKALASAAHLMAAGGDGDVEGLTDKLAETVQQAFAMGWVKNPADARRIVNVEAGLSNFAGNSAAKQEQFISGGGLGHGKELGWDMKTTQEMGALLNSSGMRTGMASARALGQLSQNVPQMGDKYRRAQRSHENTDENRAIRQAPSKLGYGSIKEMQAAILSGPLGFADFAERLRNNLDDKMRKLTLKGYGFSEQLGAPLAEVTVAKTKSVMARGDELAAQTEANDYLSIKFADWSTGLVFMLKQLEAGYKAIEAELGDVIKDDIIIPLRDWWVNVSESILNSGMKAKFHQAIVGFVHGLGFDDVAGLLRGISGSVGHFDIAGFATGLGEGIRTIGTAIKGLFDILSFGSGDAETIGKLAAELFGLSLAAMVLAPIVGIISAFAGVLKLMTGAAELTGITTALKTIVGIEAAGAATGLLAFAGALGVVAAAVEGLLQLGILNKIEVPHDMSAESWKTFAWGKNKDGSSAMPAWAGGAGASTGPNGFRERRNPLLNHESFEGGGYGNLLQNASWDGGGMRNDGSADTIKGSLVGTERAVTSILDEIRRGGSFATKASLIGGTSFGAGTIEAGGGTAGGRPNMRYGKGNDGVTRGTPGSGSTPMGTPGAGGSRSWRNNNPGNIEYGAYAKSMGATGSDGRFAIFPSYEGGRAAQSKLLFESKAYKDLTLGQAIGKWAPASENNVGAYLSIAARNRNVADAQS